MNEYKLLNLISILFVGTVCVLMFENLGSLIFLKKISLLSIDSPLVFAFLVGVVLLICIIITLIRGIFENNGDEKAKTGGSESKYGEIKKVVLYSAGLFAYIQILKMLHFNVGTAVFMCLVMLLINGSGNRIGAKLLKAIAATLVTVPILYFVFHGIFSVVLP
ncbi:MAG: tripartite tricarboxylate transporter TctB family protein [Firmicutes bacterium]|nr:tripartite tricarboxylate transporter TctB family protein [Bacillota bacterium]NSW91399.1 tripartite tricarboxylate transporter TctB family protein [Bacillota bacterium]